MEPDPWSPPRAADFGTRWSAFVIDAAILFAAQWIAIIVLARQLQAAGMTSQKLCNVNDIALCEGPSRPLWALLLLILVVSTLAYHAVFEGMYGATPGKRWMGLEVVDHQGHGPIGLSAGLIRSFVRQFLWMVLFLTFDASPLDLGLPSAVFILLPLALVAVMAVGAFARDGQAVHDQLARTAVVRGRSTQSRASKIDADSFEQDSKESEEAV